MHSEPTAHPFVTVIIPTFNEAGALAETIASVECPFIEAEIIVVDGGSTDGTAELAASAGCRVIETARKQRAAQMNLGARSAVGDVFLFLHADTRLQPGSLLAIREALRDPRIVGGAFVRRYDSSSRTLAATCRLAELRNRWLGWHLGDQAMFVRGHVFQRCGPFAEVDRFEDLDLSRRLARCGRLVTLRPPVISSARRFTVRGPALTTLRDLLLTCGTSRSVSPGKRPLLLEYPRFSRSMPRRARHIYERPKTRRDLQCRRDRRRNGRAGDRRWNGCAGRAGRACRAE